MKTFESVAKMIIFGNYPIIGVNSKLDLVIKKQERIAKRMEQLYVGGGK